MCLPGVTEPNACNNTADYDFSLQKEKKKQHSNLMEKAIREEMMFSAISMAVQIPKSEGSLLALQDVHLNN